MTAAIYYHPEGYTTSGPKLMGRNAAGESFLRGFAKYSTCEKFWAYIEQPDHGPIFTNTIRNYGRVEEFELIEKTSIDKLIDAGTLYYPGPGISELAYVRGIHAKSGNNNRHANWSLCGITHTTSSAPAMDAIASIITSPIQTWDAVICTSKSVKSNVQKILQAQVNYLEERLGITKITLPQLPVIPLGIHTSDFKFTDLQKIEHRQSLGITSNAIVVLYMGRLSFHAKAHPLAMYQALEKAAAKTNKSVVLIECGWHANQHIESAYSAASQLACPSVKVINLDGRDPEERTKAWAAADIFCSLSDNIQETFGITPIEAMAAGLPVVVSDWDGYKDTVRDGIDGFRIQTIMPPAGLAVDLAMRHATGLDTYDMYCGHTCALIAVDIDATAQAFIQLFSSDQLRQTMGEEGRKRAIQEFDWKVIIPRYENLWAELNQLRNVEVDRTNSIINKTESWPARMDPFDSFASYPSFIATEKTRFKLADENQHIAFDRYKSFLNLAMVNYAKYLFPTHDEISKILSNLTSGSKSMAEVAALFSNDRQAWIARSLIWLLKIGVLKLDL